MNKTVLNHIKALFDWDAVKRELDAQPVQALDDGRYGRCLWLGAGHELAPSGKVWTFWTNNATEEEMAQDVDFWEAFYQFVEEKFGGEVHVLEMDGEVYLEAYDD